MIYRRLGRERSVDKPEEESHSRSRLDHLQRQLDQLVGQQYGLDQSGAAEPPFTPAIMSAPYPTRFKMPSMASYDGSSDADEHLVNYRARLDPRSVSSFQQLADSFSAAFMGSKARKLGASHLFSIKQGDSKMLKAYLQRFDKAVVQAEPPTFGQLRGIAWKHAEADEYVRGRGLEAQVQTRLPGRKSDRNQLDRGKAPAASSRKEPRSSPKTPAGKFHQYTPLVTTVENVLYQVSSKGLLRDPRPIQTDRTRRNPNKYCHFHKDVGHKTKDCIQLRDQIEALIRDSHLREFVERVITPVEPSNRPAPGTRRNQWPDDQPDEPGPEHIVHTIFGGTATADTVSSRRSYAREAKRFAHGEFINMTEHVSKICRQSSTPITFTDEKVDRLLHPLNDALVGEIRVVDNVIRRILIDNGSSADVLFMDAFSRLKIGGAVLTPIQTPLYGFAEECVRAAGMINLPVAIGDGPERVTRMVEFIVVDRPSAYNVILGRPTLNAIKAVVSTYHLAMKFPTKGGIGIFQGNQQGARKYYVEAVNRVGQRTAAPITVAAIFRIEEIEAPSGEVERFTFSTLEIPGPPSQVRRSCADQKRSSSIRTKSALQTTLEVPRPPSQVRRSCADQKWSSPIRTRKICPCRQLLRSPDPQVRSAGPQVVRRPETVELDQDKICPSRQLEVPGPPSEVRSSGADQKWTGQTRTQKRAQHLPTTT
ncbi:hypothetical protein TIFTF001_014262 [Ficus carica]|uniref:Retrotransposon gag domain-containing protein n=1 Tax=Ficus carica TaxID=3494 RepID=A0AA88D5G1_FICCA|nr:hypothetical protein TIFTF001_014262 [Ficus carica]